MATVVVDTGGTGDYASMALWVAGEQGDQLGTAVEAQFWSSDNSVDVLGGVTVSGFTNYTSFKLTNHPNHPIKDPGYRDDQFLYKGILNPGAVASPTVCLDIKQDDFEVTGLQFAFLPIGNIASVYGIGLGNHSSTTGTSKFHGNVIRADTRLAASSTYLFYQAAITGGDRVLQHYNNLIYYRGRHSGTDSVWFGAGGGQTVEEYFNTLVGAGTVAMANQTGSTTSNRQNKNGIYASVTNFSNEVIASPSNGGDFCISDVTSEFPWSDTSAYHGSNNQVFATTFADTVTEDYSLHETSDASIHAAGTPVSGITVDLLGRTRNLSAPSPGCFEYIAPTVIWVNTDNTGTKDGASKATGFDSLDAAIDSIGTTGFALDTNYKIICTGSLANQGGVRPYFDLNGYSPYMLWVEPENDTQAAALDGWKTDRFRLEDGLSTSMSNLRLSGLQIVNISSGTYVSTIYSDVALATTYGPPVFENCRLEASGTATIAHRIAYINGSCCLALHNVVIDGKNELGVEAIRVSNSDPTTSAKNCLIVRATTVGYRALNAVVNCVGLDNADDVRSSVGNNILYCAMQEDITAVGHNNLTIHGVGADLYTDYANGDFRHSPYWNDGSLIGMGQWDSYESRVNYLIEGTKRDFYGRARGARPDIGPDQYQNTNPAKTALNTGHALYNNLLFCAGFDEATGNVKDLVSNTAIGVLGSSVTRDDDPIFGACVRQHYDEGREAGNGGVNFGDIAAVGNNSQLSYLVFQRSDYGTISAGNGSGNANHSILSKSGVGDDTLLCEWLNTEDCNSVISVGATAYSAAITGGLSENVNKNPRHWHAFGCTYDGTTLITRIGENEYTGSIAASGTVNETAHDLVLQALWSGEAAMVAVFDKGLSDIEWAGLAADPMSLFAAAASGHVISGDVQAKPASASGSLGVDTAITGSVQTEPATATGQLVVGSGAILTGSVQAQDAAASGSLGINSDIAGAVQAQPATSTGTFQITTNVAGSVQAQDASAIGTLEMTAGLSLTGGVQAQDALANGLIQINTDLIGTVQAQPAYVSGTFYVDLLPLGDINNPGITVNTKIMSISSNSIIHDIDDVTANRSIVSN